MQTAVYISLIIISVAVIAVVLLQTKGSGLSGGIFGGDTLYSSKRGVEKTLFNITIALLVAFIVLDLIAVIVFG